MSVWAPVQRRFHAAVEAFDRGACVEEATAELMPSLADELPEGETRDVVQAALNHLAADPPRGNREAAVRMAHAALLRWRATDEGAGRAAEEE